MIYPATLEVKNTLRAFPRAAEGNWVRSASLQTGETIPLTTIDEFAAMLYAEKEAKALSEIVRAFNERHGAQVTEEDFLRLERIKRKALEKR